jgi:hypothetical protein
MQRFGVPYEPAGIGKVTLSSRRLDIIKSHHCVPLLKVANDTRSLLMSISGWFILALALSMSNLPFCTDRVFGIISLRSGKRFWVYAMELALTYLILAATAYALEAHEGAVFVQGWQFYAITASLMAVLLFPGFVFRFLL